VFGVIVAVFAAAWAVPAWRSFVKRTWREKVRRRGKKVADASVYARGEIEIEEFEREMGELLGREPRY
jgi:hypothetical protein